MILVTVGTMYGFDRLVKAMDEIAGRMDEEVVMQIGKTSYVPRNAEYFRFASEEKFERLYRNARIIVCHAGVGSILQALGHNKPFIIVPRRKEYGEHIDNHQLEIARILEKEYKIMVVYDTDKLEMALNMPYSFNEIGRKERLIRALKDYINRMIC